MTQLSFNREIINIEKEENATLNEAINEALKTYSKDNKEVITDLELDGEKVPNPYDDEILHKCWTNFSKIEIKTKSNIDLAWDALDSCSSYIDVIVTKIKTLIELYQKNEQQEANKVFSEAIEIIDLYVQLISKIHKTVKNETGHNFANCKTIQELEIHLLSVLKALIPAKERNDIIMLCDLLEYELIDNLTQWKIKALPEMKKHRLPQRD